MPCPDEPLDVDAVFTALAGAPTSTEGVADAYYEVLYSRLYAIAKGLAPGNTLGPTDLVHEAYVRLSRRMQPPHDRVHFMRLVTRAMRHIVVDYYRLRQRQPGSLESASDVLEPRLDPSASPLDPLMLEEALVALERLSSDQLVVAELRLFAGYRIADVAATLGISNATADRRWRAAKAFLTARLA